MFHLTWCLALPEVTIAEHNPRHCHMRNKICEVFKNVQIKRSSVIRTLVISNFGIHMKIKDVISCQVAQYYFI